MAADGVTSSAESGLRAGRADDDGAAAPPRRAAVVAAAAVLAGIAFGALDLLGQVALPYPWANLANSPAIWALAAFGIGVWVRRGPLRCMLAAVPMLVVAVVTYYLVAAVALHDSAGIITSAIGVMWAAFGVIAGCVFGFAGHLRAARGFLAAALGAALPAAVLLAEAALHAGRTAHRWGDNVQTATIEVVLALATVVLAGRGLRGRALVLIISVPLAILGWFAFRVAGFAG